MIGDPVSQGMHDRVGKIIDHESERLLWLLVRPGTSPTFNLPDFHGA